MGVWSEYVKELKDANLSKAGLDDTKRHYAASVVENAATSEEANALDLFYNRQFGFGTNDAGEIIGMPTSLHSDYKVKGDVPKQYSWLGLQAQENDLSVGGLDKSFITELNRLLKDSQSTISTSRTAEGIGGLQKLVGKYAKVRYFPAAMKNPELLRRYVDAYRGAKQSVSLFRQKGDILKEGAGRYQSKKLQTLRVSSALKQDLVYADGGKGHVQAATYCQSRRILEVVFAKQTSAGTNVCIFFEIPVTVAYSILRAIDSNEVYYISKHSRRKHRGFERLLQTKTNMVLSLEKKIKKKQAELKKLEPRKEGKRWIKEIPRIQKEALQTGLKGKDLDNYLKKAAKEHNIPHKCFLGRNLNEIRFIVQKTIQNKEKHLKYELKSLYDQYKKGYDKSVKDLAENSKKTPMEFGYKAQDPSNYKHKAGILLWEFIRVRGTKVGARVPFQYVSEPLLQSIATSSGTGYINSLLKPDAKGKINYEPVIEELGPSKAAGRVGVFPFGGRTISIYVGGDIEENEFDLYQEGVLDEMLSKLKPTESNYKYIKEFIEAIDNEKSGEFESRDKALSYYREGLDTPFNFMKTVFESAGDDIYNELLNNNKSYNPSKKIVIRL